MVPLGLLGLALHKMDTTDGVWDSGLGAVRSGTIISHGGWPSELIPNVLIANVPQLVYSLLYILSNGILTSMTLAAEWNAFSHDKKGLRVSTSPRGNQRTSHFLSLPYRYGVPLIALSALIHWLISQSIYLVSADAYTDGVTKRSPDDDVLALGYSPPAIIITTCVSVLLPVSLVLLGSRRFKTGMPVAGGCSLAIAASCHPQASKSNTDDGLDIRYRRLQWGVEPPVPGETRHCTFSDADVETPKRGVFYQ